MRLLGLGKKVEMSMESFQLEARLAKVLKIHIDTEDWPVQSDSISVMSLMLVQLWPYYVNSACSKHARQPHQPMRSTLLHT